ncbi:MAG: hypothetical protein H7268_01860 [Sandarakinorhabdus sp.]|nr:hypothetical protein [Sandarakinorhabdus sp.]
MVAVIVAGFSTQLAMGRSTFASPPLVHAHAIVFMGWMAIYLLQNIFNATDNRALHRRLGWIGAGWIGLMLILGAMVTVAIVRRGQVPFFFQPVQFLVFDPLTVVFFAGLTIAAIVLRRQTNWHRRLHFCGTALLLGPGFGRLLPLPLITPWAFEANFVAVMLFPLAGVIADWRRSGRVHPAWGWGIAAMVGLLLLTNVVAYSPIGSALYASVTAGSPGASVAPLDFPPPPAGPLRTGRS